MSISESWLIGIKDETHSLQDPVTEMFCSGQVSLKHQAYPHGIPSLWGDVHWGPEGVLEFEAVGLNGDDLHDWEVLDQLFGGLSDQAAVLSVPGSSLQVQTINEATCKSKPVLFYKMFSMNSMKIKNIYITRYLYSLEQRKAWITLMSSFCDIIGTLPLCDWGVESGLVQWPAILTTSGLYQSSQVRLWDVESREPHDRGLTLIHL